MLRIINFILLCVLSTAFGQINKWKVITKEEIGIQSSGISTIVEDLDSNIWIGTWSEGLFKFDGESWINYDTSNTPLFVNEILALAVDSNNILWIGTSGIKGGLAKFDGNNWYAWELDKYGVEGTTVKDIEIDKDNNLWMGTYWDGLLKFDGNNFTLFNSETTDLDNSFEEINVVAIDDSGYIWCGSDAFGSVRFDGISEWEYFDVARTGMDYAIYSIDFDWYGNIIFGGANFVSIYDGISNWTNYRYEDFSWNWNMEIDKDSIVYFSSSKGFLKLDYSSGEEWTLLNPTDYNLDSIWCIGLTRDRKNNFWIGYNNGYLAIHNPNGITGITDIEDTKEEIPSIYSLLQNYPNPFNPTTTIKYTIPPSVMLNSFQHLNNETPKQVRGDNYNVSLTIYDILGREIKTLVNKSQQPGNYSVDFNAGSLPSGVYYYQLKAGNPRAGLGQGFMETKKMLLLR